MSTLKTYSEEPLDIVKKSGLFDDKTFLMFFGSYKFKKTGEKLQWFYKYLDCSIEEALALFDSNNFAALATKGGAQNHLHIMARYIDSGEFVAIQLEYTGPPEHGVGISPVKQLSGAEGKAVVALLKNWRGE